jgi:hypothetical protein
MSQDIDLYNKYYGHQDNYIANIVIGKTRMIKGKYVDTRTFILQGLNITTRQEILLSNIKEVESGCGYSNIQLVSDSNTTDEIILEIGQTNVDVIYPKALGQTTFQLSTTNILPALDTHKYKLHVKHSQTIKITVDIFKLINYNSNDSNEFVYDTTSFLSYLTNPTNPINLTNPTNKFKLDLNHPVKKITICAQNEYLEPNIKLDNILMHIDTHCISLKLINNICEYEFEKPVNFSNIENAFLEINSMDKLTINIFAIHQQVALIYDGMFGIKFTI